MSVRTPVFGRLLDDIEQGAIFEHPWDVTISEGAIALFEAAIGDVTPTYASAAFARALSFRERPVHPFLLFNLARGLSVHDLGELAASEEGFRDARFPTACFAGDTVRAYSVVLGRSERGVVTMRTTLEVTDGRPVCSVEHSVLLQSGHNEHRTRSPWPRPSRELVELPVLPEALRSRVVIPERRGGFPAFGDDFTPGDVIVHRVGRTIEAAEAAQLATLTRDTHPLRLDERWAREGSEQKTRIVSGALVVAWVGSLASRDTTGNALWDMGLDDGVFDAPVVAGDTLYAASKVLDVREHDDRTVVLTLRVAGTKNIPTGALIERGVDLFGNAEVDGRVVRFTRTVLARKSPGRMTLGA